MKQNGHTVEVQRTTKVDINKDVHCLPPAGGVMKEYKVADYFCPDEWSKDAVFIPVKEGQPLWFDLRANRECACLLAIQRLNPVTGEPADLEAGLSKDPQQNYLKLPEQQWLDGYANDGKVYQFVITKEGVGLAVSEHVLPKHMQDSHALGFAFYEPKNPKPVSSSPRWRSDPTVKFIGTSDVALDCSDGYLDGAMAALDCGDDCDSYQCSAEIYCRGIVGPSNNSFLKSAVVSETSAKIAEIPECDSDARELYSEHKPEVVNILEEHEDAETDLSNASMGQGGRINQKIVTDNNTVEYYHNEPSAVLTIYFALPGVFDNIMKKGKRQDKNRPDKYKMSGKVGKVQVPLI